MDKELDTLGWPIRMLDGKRVCFRPNCATGKMGPDRNWLPDEEFRIDGYCSIECRNTYEHEQEIEVLKVENKRLREAAIEIRDAELALRSVRQDEPIGPFTTRVTESYYKLRNALSPTPAKEGE